MTEPQNDREFAGAAAAFSPASPGNDRPMATGPAHSMKSLPRQFPAHYDRG